MPKHGLFFETLPPTQHLWQVVNRIHQILDFLERRRRIECKAATVGRGKKHEAQEHPELASFVRRKLKLLAAGWCGPLKRTLATNHVFSLP